MVGHFDMRIYKLEVSLQSMCMHFCFYDTIDQNDAFLKLLKYADGTEGEFPEGDVLCENLRCYSKIHMDEQAGAMGPPLIDPTSSKYATYLQQWGAAMKDGMTWKDNCFAFCIYTRGGTTQ